MLYELTKAAHIIAVIVFISGMAVAALSLRHPHPDTLPAIRAFDRTITTPAMLLTWALGIFLAVQGGWFGSGLWLSAKIGLVLVLSGLHGMIAGRLRRKVREADFSADATTRTALPLGFGLLTAIVLLVTTKSI